MLLLKLIFNFKFTKLYDPTLIVNQQKADFERFQFDPLFTKVSGIICVVGLVGRREMTDIEVQLELEILVWNVNFSVP